MRERAGSCLDLISLYYSLSSIISYLNYLYKQSMNNATSMPVGKQQIGTSFKEMDKVMQQRNEPIVDLRVKNQQLQKNSRIFDQRRAHERLVAIQQEAVASNKKNTALEIKWSELKEYEQCESLSKAINEQKETFKLIIAAKDKLINQFWEELKKKDDQYSKTLKDQASDIKILVSKMREQYFALRDQSIRQLDEIQRTFEEERKKYIKKATEEVEECFKKHIDMEQSFSLSRRRQEEEFQKAIEKLRIEGMQLYTSTKIKMENDIQNLEKCYEEMKALYQLNTQKLDYNLKILKEKKQENHQNHQQLKKKESMLNTRYLNLRKQYQKEDQKFKDINKSLTADYKRINRQFKELQRKFKHFEKSDLERYNEIQSMNEKEVQELKEKIIKCDMVIHNQQLGLDWVGFTNEEDKPEEKPAAIQREDDEDQQTQIVVGEQKLMEIIDILIEEGDFIFDDKMREELERASHEEKLKEKLEILKKTLSIDSVEELNLFIDDIANKCKYISEKEKHAIHEEKLRKQQEAREEEEKAMRRRRKDDKKEKVEAPPPPPPVQQEEPKVDLNSDFKVDPVLVVDFLVDWMNSRDQRKKMLERTTKRSLKQLSEREKKDLIARQGKKYWQKMTQVLPDRTFRIWKILDKSLSKYHDLLQSRQKLINETGQLHNQNEELKNLLNQYIRINHELIIPPTKLMEKEG